MKRFKSHILAAALLLQLTGCGTNAPKSQENAAKLSQFDWWQPFIITGQDGIPLPRYDGFLTAHNDLLTFQWRLDPRRYAGAGIIPVVDRVDGAQNWFQALAGPTRAYTFIAYRHDGATETPYPPITIPTVLVGGYPNLQITEQPNLACPNEVVRISWFVTGCSRVRFYGPARNDIWDCQPGHMETTVAVPETTTFNFELRNSEEQFLNVWRQVTVQVGPQPHCP